MIGWPHKFTKHDGWAEHVMQCAEYFSQLECDIDDDWLFAYDFAMMSEPERQLLAA